MNIEWLKEKMSEFDEQVSNMANEHNIKESIEWLVKQTAMSERFYDAYAPKVFVEKVVINSDKKVTGVVSYWAHRVVVVIE